MNIKYQNGEFVMNLISERLKNVIIVSFLTIFSIGVFSVFMQSNAYAHKMMNVNNPIFQFKKGMGALKGGYNYTAIQHFQKAILLKPHFADAWGKMGIALHRLGFPSLGIVSLKKALSYNPKLVWAKKFLKKYMAETGR
jgi:tetratricopeptide (TPR) repeat protein